MNKYLLMSIIFLPLRIIILLSLGNYLLDFFIKKMELKGDYKIFMEFIDAYLPVGFEGINREDPLMQKINSMMKKNRQYFYFGDMLKFKITYTCSTLKDLLGLDPIEFDPGIQYKITHPEDMKRHGVSRSKMIKITNDIFTETKGYFLMSTNMRFRHAQGHYINFIVQAYAFYSEIPEPTVYGLFVTTDISWFGPLKNGYNFYVGTDPSYFRVPDKELITTGCFFSDREYEVLNLIRQGYDSKTIGEKLFLSTHTVDTHRRNIIKKSGQNSTSELIIDLQERGFF